MVSRDGREPTGGEEKQPCAVSLQTLARHWMPHAEAGVCPGFVPSFDIMFYLLLPQYGSVERNKGPPEIPFSYQGIIGTFFSYLLKADKLMIFLHPKFQCIPKTNIFCRRSAMATPCISLLTISLFKKIYFKQILKKQVQFLKLCMQVIITCNVFFLFISALQDLKEHLIWIWMRSPWTWSHSLIFTIWLPVWLLSIHLLM